jgi:DNA-binding NtrC family response regulator
MTSASILVVDDELGIRSTIQDILADEGYRVSTAADAKEARIRYEDDAPDLVLLDIWMPDTDGISLLKEWSEGEGLQCPVVVISGHGTVETAVEATRLGAVDFIEKPLSLEQLLSTVKMALVQQPVPPVTDTVAGISLVQVEAPQGKSPAIRATREQAREIAVQRVSVLITGESGCGRDLFARYIHSISSRAAGPFIQISAASLTGSNAVEQLVGFSSGTEKESGLLGLAKGGTLFISELQELGAHAQSLLVSIVEQGGYTRPGKASPEPADVRIMASVQRTGGAGLRADLLSAMSVLQLSVPPLRDYAEDIPDLLRYYVNDLVSGESLNYRRFSVAAQNRLRNYPWPGNLRELKNLLRKLLISGSDAEVGLVELEASLEPAIDGAEPLVRQDVLALPMREAREHFERAYLTQQLALCGGKVGKLAGRVGMERTHLYRKLRALKIDFGQSSIDD